MTVYKLIEAIERAGYTLNGKDRISPSLLTGRVLNAPVVLIPHEPPVQSECVMVPNVLDWQGWKGDWQEKVKGYARIEGAASIEQGTGGLGVVHLQFVQVG